jgi:DNA polymerase III subunit delta'
MIQEKLISDHKINKLHNSYLIKSDDLDKALEEVKKFLVTEIFIEQNFSRNDDFRMISRVEGNVKNISIDQIRQLKLFLSKSSVLSGKKVAIIYDAEYMNSNASNACLKILEDTPKNSYLFLLVKNMSAILPTIRSRCAKINCIYNKVHDNSASDLYIKPLLKTTSVKDRLNFINEFAKKDRDLWLEFSESLEIVINKFCRKIIDSNYNLSESETQLFAQLECKSLVYLQNKYAKINTISENTIKYDLDLRASCVLLIEAFILS